MATVANDLDVFLSANPAPAEPAPANRDLLVFCSSPGGFKVPTSGSITPASITFDAAALAMPGAVIGFSATGGTITTSGNRATLTSANATTDTITVTATTTFEGVTYTRVTTVQKVYDGAKGADGASPNKNGIAFLYKWSTSAPTKPAGTSTFTWAGGANTAYGGADGWSITVPTNPGTPLIQLFVAQIAVTDVAAATSTTVSYASSTVTAWSQNGSNGSNGVTGIQSGDALLYQWAATIPAGPVGTPTFIWSTGLFGAAPANWSLTPGTAPSLGMTLWQARVGITDSAANTQTAFNWSAASILAVGYAGTNGNNGTPAMYVDISTSGGQVFSRANSAASFAPTSITLTATPYGGTASAYQWQYLNAGTWTNIASATTATYAPASGDFTGSRVYRVQATIGGTVYTDEMTLVQVTGGTNGTNGTNAVVGFLTNEAVTLAAGNDGTVSGGFGSAGGTFKIFDGLTDKTGNAAVTYSVFAESGVDVSIASTGVYSVVSMGSDTGTATLRAVYNGVTYDQIYSIAKARAGASVTGAEGASYVTAYCASTSVSTSTAPTATVGRNSVPAVNGGGITGTWVKPVPALANDQRMWQTDGIYNPANDTVTWSIPYVSSAKYGSLSAIVANMGQITAGSIDLGTGATSWHIDSLGNQWAGAASFASAPFRLENGGAATFSNVTISGGRLNIGSAATSFHVDSAGNHWAGADTYASAPFKVSSDGVMTATSGTFSGTLVAPTGTLGALSIPAGGYITGGSFTGWSWPASGGGFVLEARGLLVGNKVSGTTGYFEALADGTITAPGFSLVNKQLTLTNPVIVSPQYTAFGVSVPSNTTGGTAAKTVTLTCSATVTGTAKSISWTLQDTSTSGSLSIVSGANTATVTVKSLVSVQGANIYNTGTLTCTAISSGDNRADVAVSAVSVNHI